PKHQRGGAVIVSYRALRVRIDAGTQIVAVAAFHVFAQHRPFLLCHRVPHLNVYRRGRRGCAESAAAYNPLTILMIPSRTCGTWKFNKISKLEPAETKIAEKLTAMDGKDCCNRFEFDDHATFDENINAIPIVYRQLLILDGQQHLSFDPETALFELV